jgi:hypothetical protein
MVSLGQQVLQMLVAKLGSPEQAAARLGITDTLVQHLSNGTLPIPDSLLLKVVDILNNTSEARSASTLQPSAPKDPTAT